MPALLIVEHLDIFEHVGLCFVSGAVMHPVDSLPLHHAKKALDHCVVIAASRSAHAGRHAVLLQLGKEVIACILGATVRMMDQAVRWLAATYGHPQGIHYQVAAHATIH